jgi:hypothetical protein
MAGRDFHLHFHAHGLPSSDPEADQRPASQSAPDRQDEPEGTAGDVMAAAWGKAIEASPLLGKCADPDRVHAVVAECARRCRDATGILLAQTGLGDPWTDENYPVRVLRTTELLLRNAGFLPGAEPGQPGNGRMLAETPGPQASAVDSTRLRAAEAALLIAGPFLREAVLAEGIRDAASISPANFDRTFTPGARGDLELTHEMHQHLVQRIAGLRERAWAARHAGPGETSASEQLALWLVHRWLAGRVRHWEGAGAGQVYQFGASLIRDRPGGVADDEEVMLVQAVLLAIAAEPADTRLIGKLTGQHVHVRWRFAAAILWLAGIMAADPRRLPSVVANLVGTRMELPLSTVRDAAGRLASWDWHRQSGTLDLRLACDHPALHDAFDDIAHRAGKASETIQAGLGLPAWLAARLPRQVIAAPAGLRPKIVKTIDGEEPAYEVPLSRFQLAEEKVRELLMGQQLYNDRKLALRELYQNALDACRWRAIREEYLARKGGLGHASWTGLIRFTQGTDNGRPFIECEDNGVGMDVNTLKHVFANAGERFVYGQDFRAEQAEWADFDPQLSMVSNSQFGIGVFSYFMLADEITVVTRHQGRSGLPDPQAYEVRIASSGGLFQMKPAGGVLRGCGTRVRLYLSGNAGSVSVLGTVREFLWIAEHRVEIMEGPDKEAWEAGELRLEPTRIRSLKCGEDLWWVSDRGGLVADGIRLSATAGNPGSYGLVVNLRGKHRPQFTLDRNRLRGWDEKWVSQLARESVPALMGWPSFTLGWLWRVARSNVTLGQQIFEYAIEAGQALETWQYRVGAVRLDVAGCMEWDSDLIDRSGESSFAPWLRAWRAGVWRHLGADPESLPEICAPQCTEGFPVPEPIDQALLGDLRAPDEDYGWRSKPWPADTLWPKDHMPVLRSFAYSGRTIRARLRRLRRYAIIGLDLSWARCIAPADRIVGRDEIPLFAVVEGWSPPGAPPRRGLHGSWLKSTELRNLPPGEILRRARVLAREDWTAPEIELGEFARRSLTSEEWALLDRVTWDDEGCGKVEPPGLGGLARTYLRESLGEVLDRCDRLAPLGVVVPCRDAYPRELDSFEKKAFPHIRVAGQALSQLDLVRIAGRTGVTVGEAHRALARLEQHGVLTRPRLTGAPELRPTPRDLDLLSSLEGPAGSGGAQRGHARPALRIAEIITRRRPQDRAHLPAARTLAPYAAPARFASPELVAAAYWLETTLAGAADALRNIYPAAELPSLAPECADLAVLKETGGVLLDLREELVWRLGPGPIVSGALTADQPLGDFLGRLAPFRAMGAGVPPFDEAIRDALNQVELDPYDEDMLTVPDESGRRTFLRSITPLGLVRIAGRLGWTPVQAHERLSRLIPVGLTLEYPSAGLPDEIVRWQDLLLLTTYFDGQPPVVSGRVGEAYLDAATAEIFDTDDPAEIAGHTAWLRTRLALYAPLFQLVIAGEGVSD